jgi:tripartite-type tricarboxylate transporter receptor subunit TctC
MITLSQEMAGMNPNGLRRGPATHCAWLLWVTVASMAASGAFAADYPSRPIRFINPTAPGGSAEPIARVIAQKLGESLGQTVVVDSRGGAGGTTATAAAANAAPDSYTLLLGLVSPMAINVIPTSPRGTVWWCRQARRSPSSPGCIPRWSTA